MPFTFNPFSGNFDNTPSTDKGDTSYTNLLANSGNWNSNYSLVQSKSANWDIDIDTGVRSLTSDYAVKTELVKYFPLSGGTITGNTQINSNLTVYGNISATGNSYFSNTFYSTTSALSVINIGNTGPALYVGNNGTGDIASFYDLDQNIEVFHIGGNNGTFPNVGVKTSNPNVDFTVNGQISSNNIIFARDGNSNDWNSNYTLVQSKSANWDIDIDTGVRSLTGDYAVKSELVKYLPLSGGTVTGNVYLLSALKIGTGGDTLIVRNNFITANASISSNNIIFAKDGNSDNWNSNYSLVQGKSSSWDSAFGSAGADLLVRSITGGWVGGNSAFITLCSLSGNLNSVYSQVNSNSANWNFTYRNITNYLPLSGGTVTGIVNFLTSIDIKGVTNISNDLYVLSSILINNNSSEISTLFVTNSTVGINTETPNVQFTVNGQISSNNTIFSNNGNSNLWNSVYTNVNITSAFWDSSRTYVNSNSSNFILDGGNTKGSNLLIGTNDNFNLTLETNNTPRITIFNSGNVGIGTSTPNEKLTVVGNLTVTGNISSSQILFSGNGNSDNWNSNYSLVQGKSSSWDSAFGSAGADLLVRSITGGWVGGNSAFITLCSLSGNLNSVYSTVNTNSANWNYQGTDIKLLTGFWDASRTYVNSNSGSLNGVFSLTGNYASVYSTVSTNSANWNFTYLNQSNYLPLSGGTITGNIRINSNLTVYGNVSATGNSYFSNTFYSTTSALSVINIGNTGPALYVGNNGTGDIASFYDLDQNIEVFHIGGNNGTFPNVGVKTSNPNVDFTVNGNISASGFLYGNGSNLTGINTSTIDSGVRGLTGNYNSVFSTVSTNSSRWVLEDFIVACSDEATNLTTSISAVTFRVPYAMFLNSIRASVNDAPVGSTIIVDVKQTGTSIFSTKLSIDANEETSTTAATPAVISNPNLTDDAKVIVSIDQVGSSTAGRGLKLTFKGYRV